MMHLALLILAIGAAAQDLAPSPPPTGVLGSRMTCSHSTATQQTTCTVVLAFADADGHAQLTRLPSASYTGGTLQVVHDGCTHAAGSCTSYEPGLPLCNTVVWNSSYSTYNCSYTATVPSSAYTVNTAKKVNSFTISLIRAPIYDSYQVLVGPEVVLAQAETGNVNGAALPAMWATVAVLVAGMIL